MPFGDKALKAIARIGAALGKETKAEVAGQGVMAGKIKIYIRAHIRYAGTDTALVVAAGSPAAMKRAFEKAHRSRFGFIDRTKQMVVEAVSVEAVGGGAKFSEKSARRSRTALPKPALRTKFFPAERGIRQMSTPASSSNPERASKVPQSLSSRTKPSWSNPAGKRN